ncbi:MAG: hypothetical protein D6719_03955 [Candidatus Dadabacteria bacterium]|nr:MAG: hypothetical protein D6719_03955 [Candidatus Dadabacteria bacterium]
MQDLLNRRSKRALYNQRVNKKQRLTAPAVAAFLILSALLTIGFSPLFPLKATTAALISQTADLPGDRAALKSRQIKSLQLKRTVLMPVLPEGLKPEVSLIERASGRPTLQNLPAFKKVFAGRSVGLTRDQHVLFYTVDPEFQQAIERIVAGTRASHLAITAIDPKSGRILAISGKSRTIRNIELHAEFPAASLFKLVTASAALEKGVLNPESEIKFRGGIYTLNSYNYRPSKRYDRRRMTLREALAHSCNPVFGRVALNYLSSDELRYYANRFYFNRSLGFDVSMDMSTASVPDQPYGLSRTAAGFGKVTISPVHAASIMAAIANKGVLKRPYLIDNIFAADGNSIYQTEPEQLGQMISPLTAKTLLDMMTETTISGTSSKEFARYKRPVLPGIQVAAKTGTLRGSNPPGLNRWFIAAAPAENPRIAISVIVVNPYRSKTRASAVGRRVLETFFSLQKDRKTQPGTSGI